MTLLMIWREGLAERVWMASDSRVSTIGSSGRVRLTDHAAKILEAQVVLRAPPQAEPPVRSSTIGFGFTGSALVALQAYSAVLPLWSRLSSSGEQSLPTVGDCAEHMAKFAEAYARDIAESGGRGDCECVLLGRDDPSGEVTAWLVEVRTTSSGVTAPIRRLELKPGQAELFGSGAPEAERLLAEIRRPQMRWAREPLFMIRRHTRWDEREDVGGGVQIGMATGDGFELYFDCPSFAADLSAAGDALVSMKYRGFEFSEIGRVGHTFVTLRGVDH